MAIIVENIKSTEKYIVLGAGFGMYKSTRPGVLGGSLFPHEDEGNEQVVAVSDRDGKISFMNISMLKVIEVDGFKIEDLAKSLKKSKTVSVKENYKCPGCDGGVAGDETTCQYCGLRLQ